MDSNTAMVAILVNLFLFALIVTIVGLAMEYKRHANKTMIEKRKIELLENAVLMGYKPEQLNELREMINDTVTPKTPTQKISESIAESISVAAKSLANDRNQSNRQNQHIKY